MGQKALPYWKFYFFPLIFIKGKVTKGSNYEVLTIFNDDGNLTLW